MPYCQFGVFGDAEWTFQTSTVQSIIILYKKTFFEQHNNKKQFQAFPIIYYTSYPK